MAIVFTSINKKQKTFLNIITSVLVLVLFIMPFIIFSSLLRNEPEVIILEEPYKPDININFNVLDSREIKNLEPFPIIQIEFNYSALDKNNKKVISKIFATDKNNAESILIKNGFKNIILEEVNINKKEPFAPYY